MDLTATEKRSRQRKKDRPGEPLKNGTKGSYAEGERVESAIPLEVEAPKDHQDISDAPYVAPHGVLVYDGEPHTPEWFETRRNGITATDLPKIMGSTKRGNPLDVWLDKQGIENEKRDPELDELAYWGTAMEPIIAERWANDFGLEVSEVGIIANDERPWQRASVDRMVHNCPDGPCSLEIKTRSEYTTGMYEDGRIPQDILDQCEWGRSTSGFSHTHLAVLAGRKMFAFDLPANPRREGEMLSAAKALWDKNLTGKPPVIVPNGDGSLIDTMDRLYPYRSGDKNVESATVLPLVAAYNAAHEVSLAAETKKTAAKEALIIALDDGDSAIGEDGEPVFTYKATKSSSTVTTANLKALEKEDPNLMQELRNKGVVTLTKSSPRFSMKSKIGRTKKEQTKEESS